MINHFKAHIMNNGKYEKGDWVKVWSLQSWKGGGFLNGATAFVKQTQIGDSVILCVERNLNGMITVDDNYEVYAEQCKLIVKEKIDDAYKRIMENPEIK